MTMRSILTVFAVALLFVSPAKAEELSCADLKILTEMLDLVADALSDTDASEIATDKEFDKAMEKISIALKEVAAEEDSDALQDAADEMYAIWQTEGAWTEDQFSDFRMAFDSSVMSVERIHDKECD